MMAIEFTCPHCGHQTHVDPKFAGKSGPCASCGHTITIPWSGELVEATSEPSGKKSSAAIIVLIVLAASAFCIGGIVLLWLILAPAVSAARSAAARAQCQNNAQRIAAAIQAYHDEHGNYPPAYTTDDQGTPLHSWRVLILPYFGPEEAALYREFDLGQTWDTPVNRMLVNRMPSVYACPADSARSLSETSYCVVNGPGFIFNGSRTVSQSQVVQGDGLGQTLMIVEVASSSIEWTEPKDVDAAHLAQGMNSGIAGCCGSKHRGGIVTAFADLSATFLTDVTTAEELHDLATFQGGELVPKR